MNAISGRILSVWLPLSALLFPLLESPGAGAGIPEPSLVFYGTVRNISMENVRVTTGTLTWRFTESNGWTSFFSVRLTNVLDQFSYVLEVPCEQMISTSTSSNALNLTGTAKMFDWSSVTYEGSPVGFTGFGTSGAQLSVRDRGRMMRVDLIIAAPCLDTDDNGLCDEWEIDNIGYIGANPKEDPDHDGMSNELEYRAGTHPLDPESVFQFLSMQYVGPASVKLDWQSADGRYYSILKYPSLKSTSPTVVLDKMLATAAVTSWVDTNASPSGANFYRLRLEP